MMDTNIDKVALRPGIQTFMEKTPTSFRVTPKYIIEIKHNRRWTMLGDENGVFKFDTPEERNAKLQELRSP